MSLTRQAQPDHGSNDRLAAAPLTVARSRFSVTSDMVSIGHPGHDAIETMSDRDVVSIGHGPTYDASPTVEMPQIYPRPGARRYGADTSAEPRSWVPLRAGPRRRAPQGARGERRPGRSFCGRSDPARSGLIAAGSDSVVLLPGRGQTARPSNRMAARWRAMFWLLAKCI